jgi:hypothetical protein
VEIVVATGRRHSYAMPICPTLPPSGCSPIWENFATPLS